VVNAVLLALAMTTSLASAPPHPIHSSVTSLTVDARTAVVAIDVRVYTDDLEQALGADWLPRIAGYVSHSIVLRAADGQRLPLGSCGVTIVEGMARICMRGGLRSTTGLRLGVTLLTERFADQVNVVKTEVAGRSQTMLFVKGAAERVMS
jgi:hypothetical protein